MSLVSDPVCPTAPLSKQSPLPTETREWRLASAWCDLPDLDEPNSLFLRAITARLVGVGLDVAPGLVSADAFSWNRTLFGQACSYRYATSLQGQAKAIGSPLYRTRHVEGPFIRSAVLVRAKDAADGLADLNDRVLAFDGRDLSSQNLLRADVAAVAGARPFFRSLLTLPSILRTTQALADGEADALLIDGVSLSHLQRLRPALTGKLRLLFWTSRAPAPPFMTSAKINPPLTASIRSALSDAMRDPTLAEIRKALLLGDIVILPDAHYRSLVHFEQMAQSQGYPDLR